ncbi:MAG: PKD domain-containing protein [Fibrobacterales bacterium]
MAVKKQRPHSFLTILIFIAGTIIFSCENAPTPQDTSDLSSSVNSATSLSTDAPISVSNTLGSSLQELNSSSSTVGSSSSSDSSTLAAQNSVGGIESAPSQALSSNMHYTIEYTDLTIKVFNDFVTIHDEVFFQLQLDTFGISALISSIGWDFDGDTTIDSLITDSISEGFRVETRYTKEGTYIPEVFITLNTGVKRLAHATTPHSQVTVVNPPPQFSSCTAASGDFGVPIEFECLAIDSNRSATDGTIIAYQWDFNGDSTIDTSTSINQITYTYPNQLTDTLYTVTVHATDDDSNTIHTSFDISLINSPPIAYNPKIIGHRVPDSTLHTTYKYIDPNGDLQSGVTFQWFRSGDTIPGATDSTYLVTKDDIYHAIGIIITPLTHTGRQARARTNPDVAFPITTNPYHQTTGTTSDDVAPKIALGADDSYAIVSTVEDYAFEYKGWIKKYTTASVLQWNTFFEYPYKDRLLDIIPTSDGGFIATGSCEVHDDNFTDVWAIKVDSNGNKEWDEFYGGSRSESGAAILKSRDEGYIIAGYTNSSDGLVGEHTRLVSPSFWIINIYESGHFKSGTTYGKVMDNSFIDLTYAPNNGYIIIGMDYDALTSSSKRDVYAININASGTIDWERHYGTESNNWVKSIIPHPNTGYLFVGHSFSSANGQDGWVVYINESGGVEWEFNIGDAYNQLFHDIIATPDGSFFAVGETGVPGKNTEGWIVKISNTGTILWEKTFGGDGADSFNSIVHLSTGHYIVAGTSESTSAPFHNLGGKDIWTMKLTADGDLVE